MCREMSSEEKVKLPKRVFTSTDLHIINQIQRCILHFKTNKNVTLHPTTCDKVLSLDFLQIKWIFSKRAISKTKLIIAFK